MVLYTESVDTHQQFEQLVEDAKKDTNVMGLILVGSRGKGFENEHSDYDALLVVQDEVVNQYKEQYEKQSLDNIDLGVVSLSDFRNYATAGSVESWEQYDYTHAKILIDKEGEVADIARQIGTISDTEKEKLVSAWLDGYINGVFRSVKSIRNENQLGALLEASASIPFLLDVLFGIHGRPKPFVGYLAQELELYPLEKLPWSANEFESKVTTILTTADLETQQEVLAAVEKLARDEGFTKVFDDWEGKDKWAMAYKPGGKNY